MKDNLLHIKKASELLNISEEEMNNLIEDKTVPFVISSMTKMIEQSTIDAWLKFTTCGVCGIYPKYKDNKCGSCYELLKHLYPNGVTVDNILKTYIL